MILKIREESEEKNNAWIYFDNVQRINSYIPDDYKLAYGGRDEGGFPFLRLHKINTMSNMDGSEKSSTVNRRCCMCYDEMLFDTNIILNQIDQTEDPKDSESKDTFWTFRVLEIFFDKSDERKTCILLSNECYLLNNEGKTIERL